jgi:hypothetical protein
MVAVTTKKKAKKATKKTTVGSNGAAKPKKKDQTKKELASREILGMKRTKIVNPNANSWGQIIIEIKGDTGMMPRQFSKKIQTELEEKHAGAPRKKRPPKDKVADFLDSFHVIGRRPKSMAAKELRDTRFGFPVTGFKKALESAAFGCGWSSADFRRCVKLVADEGYLVELKTSIPTLDTRWVGLKGPKGRVPDIRHRPFFAEWSATLHILYNARLITAAQVVVFCDDAGSTGGIGELRVGKSSAGEMGTWKIVSSFGDVPTFA